MVDISMCQNENCPLKTGCYRYMAIHSHYNQSYCDFEPYVLEYRDEGIVLNCENYISTKGRRLRNV